MLPLLNLYSQDSSAYSKLYQDSGFSCGVVDVPLTSNEYFQPASTNQFSSDLELCSFHVISVPIHESGYPPYINRWLRSNHPEIMTEDSNE